jgi:hypothetical protein
MILISTDAKIGVGHIPAAAISLLLLLFFTESSLATYVVWVHDEPPPLYKKRIIYGRHRCLIISARNQPVVFFSFLFACSVLYGLNLSLAPSAQADASRSLVVVAILSSWLARLPCPLADNSPDRTMACHAAVCEGSRGGEDIGFDLTLEAQGGGGYFADAGSVDRLERLPELVDKGDLYELQQWSEVTRRGYGMV